MHQAQFDHEDWKVAVELASAMDGQIPHGIPTLTAFIATVMIMTRAGELAFGPDWTDAVGPLRDFLQAADNLIGGLREYLDDHPEQVH